VPGKRIGAVFVAGKLSGDENADHFLRDRGLAGRFFGFAKSCARSPFVLAHNL
jgi:hypothetical protein